MPNVNESNLELGNFAPSIYFFSTLTTIAEKKASSEINALKKTGEYWKRISGKYPGRIASALEESRFTKVLMESAGKKLFFIGLGASAVSVYNNPSAENIALNILDTAFGIAAFVPGLQVAALIYTTVRIGYDLYKSNEE